MELPDWLRDMLQPIESNGKGSINVYAGKRLEDLENDPRARVDALNALEESGPTAPPVAPPAPAPVPAAPAEAPDPDRWAKMEEEARLMEQRNRAR